MKVESIAECSPWSIAIIGLENQFYVVLRVAVLHRFYFMLQGHHELSQPEDGRDK